MINKDSLKPGDTIKAKPNWLNRQMARLLLGWKWKDEVK